MELIIEFKKADFTKDGIHLPTGKFVLELQQDWELEFHQKFAPL